MAAAGASPRLPGAPPAGGRNRDVRFAGDTPTCRGRIGRRPPDASVTSVRRRLASVGPQWLDGPRGGVHVIWDAMAERATFRLKTGLAEMLKGGVIMDVVTPEQAKIAEEAGRLRGDGAGARARRHPPGRRRRADVRPDDDQGDPGGGDDPGDGEGADRPLRRGPGPAGARGRLHRRVRGADPGRRASTTSTSSPSRCPSSAAPPTSARRCGGSARARR